MKAEYKAINLKCFASYQLMIYPLTNKKNKGIILLEF